MLGGETITMEIDYRQFGRQIKSCRKAKHLSQEELAEMSGLSVSNLSYIENGERRGSLDSIFAISSVLEVPIDTFLLGQGTNSALQYSNAYQSLFEGCTKFEAQVIYEMGEALKTSFKRNSRLFNDSKRNR